MGDFKKLLGKRDPPPAPATVNPVDVINASTTANRYNINSPTGSRSWAQGEDGKWTMTDTANPLEQQNYEGILGNNIDVTGIAGGLNRNMRGVDPNAVYDQLNAPVGGGSDWESLMANYMGGGGGGGAAAGANYARINTNLSGVDALGGDFSGDSKAAQDAIYKQWEQQANPGRERAQRAMEQRLANQGLVVGSAAYNDEMNRLSQAQSNEANDAGYRSIMAGNQRQNELWQQALAKRQQGVSEQFGIADRDIAQRNADVSSATAMGSAGINAGASNFNARLNALSNRYNTDRSTELARRGQLLSADAQRFNQFNTGNTLSRLGSQLPNFGSGGQVDVNGAYGIGNQSNQLNYQGQLQDYNIRSNNDQQAGQNIAQLFAMFSDRRLKEGIKEVGETKDGQPIYTYRYKGSPMTQMGVMADEMKKSHPDAVHRIGKYDAVDYSKVT